MSIQRGLSVQLTSVYKDMTIFAQGEILQANEKWNVSEGKQVNISVDVSSEKISHSLSLSKDISCLEKLK